MTAAQTASQRGKANRTRGHQAERDVCKYLRANGWPHAERAVRAGFAVSSRSVADPGDITGTPGLTWSVKDCAREYIDTWMDELDDMCDHATTVSTLGLLVVKRRGRADPGQWWCWLADTTLTTLADGMRGDDVHSFGFGVPIRMELRHAVMYLRGAGYGDPS